MSFSNEAVDIMSCEFPAIISDPESYEIKEYNHAAASVFQLDDDTNGILTYELFGLMGENLQWYQSIPLQVGEYDFRPMRISRYDGEVILDSAYLEDGESVLRIDVISPVGIQNRQSYYCKLELASNGQRWDTISNRDVDEDVPEILKAVLFTYAADRAYVVEFDTNLKCLADLYTRSRIGFDDTISTVRTIGDEGLKYFADMWNSGREDCMEEYKKDDYKSGELYSQLYDSISSWSYMIVPFRRQSGIRCFLCVDNVRRFFGKQTLLRNYALMIENCMYSAKLYESTLAARSLASELSHIPEDTLKIYLLGGLRTTTSAGIQQELNSSSTQCGTFFVYLLSNRHRLVPVRELSDVLWPDELVDNPYNMIKNVAFRTRKMFENICDKPVIVASSGTYQINNELKIWLDVEEFEKQCKKAKDSSLSRNHRLNACKKAFNLYSGGMLPNFDSETWLMTRICYYQILYCELIKVYIGLLNEENDYTLMFSIVAQAMERERLDSDIHLMLMEALMRNGRRDLAKNYYGKIKPYLTKSEDTQFRSMWSNFD